MKNLRRAFALGIALAGIVTARRAAANDRDLLYEKRAAAPNVMILVANTESMAACEPGDTAMANGQTCTALSTGFGSNLAPLGIGDSPYSKMGKAKSAILSIINANASSFNFGLSSESYSRQTAPTGVNKRYTFVAQEGSFCDGSTGNLYWACQPTGTALTFGPAVGTATTTTYGSVNYTVLPIGGVTSGTYVGPTANAISSGTNLGNETWIQTYGGDTSHQPYLLYDPASPATQYGMIITNPTGYSPSGNPGTASKQEMVITYSSTTASSANPYRIHQCAADCTLTDSGFDGQKLTVTKSIVECTVDGKVNSITVTNGGSGYTSAPGVTITGGGGSGAAATATIAGTVQSVTITSAGSGYTSTPTVGFSGGGGSGATGTVNLGGVVSGVTITAGGSGYSSAPTVNFSGGGGSGAAGTATISGSVGSITITNGGSGYASAPTVSFGGGGGSGAAATTAISGSVSSLSLVNQGSGYTSTPTCTLTGGGGSGATCSVTRSGSKINKITLLLPGSGYTSAPTVAITGGGGSGATATATISASVVSVTFSNHGTGYTSAPTVSFSSPGGGGTNATGTATLSASVTGVTVTSGGSGYTSTPTVSFSGGGGSGAAGTVTTSGVVSSVTITNAGTGYTSAPTVTFTGGGGSGADGTANISGSVVSVNVTNGGSGYTSTPTVTFTGGGGSGATGTAVGGFGTASYPCNPANGTTKAGPVTVDYVVPPLTGTYSSSSGILMACTETTSNCDYPTVFGYGSTNAAAGEEMGWINYCDLQNGCGQNLKTVSGNQSGWITQRNNNQQPMVMIPHPYTPWKAYTGSTPLSGTVNYTQSSSPCIQRSFRPLSAIIDNSTSHTQTDSFPMFTPATGQIDDSTNLSSTECDKMVDGLWQTGLFPNGNNSEIAPVVFPAGHNGAGIDLVKILTNAYQYFNGGNQACTVAGGGVDGFCGGSRPDDPFSGCRQSAIILITDSFTGSSPDFQFGQSGDPTTQLKSINVPVFVIGYAMALNSSGTCSKSVPGVTGTANTGQCIAYYSGATTFGTDARQGYFSVSDASDLAAAFQGVLNSLNTATRDFATATIPSVSATSAGIAYLSQFNPKNNRSIWEGHLRAYFLDPLTGLVQSAGNPAKPDPTHFTFWGSTSSTTGASGSIIWDAGGTNLADSPITYGHLDGLQFVDPTLLLTDKPGPGGKWSDDSATGHDQVTTYPSGGVGRNVFFGVKPGDTGCSVTFGGECLAQVPVGTGGTGPTPLGSTDYATAYVAAENAASGNAWSVPSAPSSKPSWWDIAKGSSYVNLPGTTPEGSADQALQNSFSFLRGNRDPVVEALKISTLFDSTHTTCASLIATTDTPCYYGDVMGDLFHSNPTIVSAPTNFRYYFAQDPGTATPGTYADRGAGYQTFQSDHAHRRKILYVGGNDGALHALDVGVYNGDQSTWTNGTTTVCPLCNKYDFGSGREIFAYVPRAGLNKAYNLAHTITYNWTVDGPPSIEDVYIDTTRAGGSVQGVAPSGSTTDSDLSGATPASVSHSWRTVLVGTEREGGLTTDGGGITSGVSGNGGSVFALDVTDPDQTAHMKSSDTGGHTGVPECIVADFTPGTTSVPSNCTAPFPRILWELRDDQSTTTTPPVPTELSTAAAATTQDLGMTWSQPVIGRVKINTDATTKRDFFVAIFGGGYDHTGTSLAATNASGNTGNFLYMVDVETGKIIYKKNLGVWSSGASGTSTAGNLTAGVPGSPAVIDINNDGYLDTVYIGDTQGRLWKVDLTASATLDATTKRVQTGDWNPTLFFDEYLNAAAQGTSARQPIFDRPAEFFISNTSTGSPKIGIAFGTGDRDNMPISTDTNQNMFVVVADPPARTQAVDNDHPLTLADLTLASVSSNLCTSSTCLNENGWYLNLPVGTAGAQIVNTDPLVFNQQIFFNTFLHSPSPGDCNEIGVPYIYIIDYATGVGTVTQGATGSEVLSTDIIYEAGGGANSQATGDSDNGSKVNVTTSGDDTSQQNVKTGLTPNVKIKSWKEE